MSIFPRLNLKSPRQTKPSSFPLIRELTGILLITLGLLLVLSIWTHSPQDALLWNGDRTGKALTGNVVGLFGASISFGLLWLVGWTAYVVAFLVMLQGIRAFQEESWGTRVRSLGGSVIGVICAAALLHLFLNNHGSVLQGGDRLKNLAGGVTGQTLASVLRLYFADIGTMIVLIAGLLISLQLIKPFSLASKAQQVSRVGPLVWTVGKWLSLVRIPFWEKGKRIKANKPVKINRSLALRGGALSFDKTLALEEETAPFSDKNPVEENDDDSLDGESVGMKEFTAMSRRVVAQGYAPPDPSELLECSPEPTHQQSDQILENQSHILVKALQSFGIGGKVTEVHPGPVITMFEFEPNPGIKVARIVTLAHDLAMALKATSVRIVAPLPGKSTVGIEVPNPARETVSLRDILTHDAFVRSRSKLALALGKDIFGRPVVADLKTMPHLLVAGATGAGKSVGLNSMLLSILFSAHPDEVKLLLIDPKVLELQVYDGIPHLLRPVITNPKAAAKGLTWVVQEMERRYRLLAEHGVRNIQAYNLKMTQDRTEAPTPVEQPAPSSPPFEDSFENPSEDSQTAMIMASQEQVGPPEPLPYIVVVIDEFADLMMVAPKEIEEKIARLAQMARASGIHLILATQRPSVDVVTGLIKANFPARIAYQVSSKIDSRTILDANGAEALLGLGDMLYMASGTGRITRLHGSYVADDDVRRVVDWIKAQAGPAYFEEPETMNLMSFDEDHGKDEIYEQARELILSTGQASASLIQRRLRVGYPRAARMIEQMEDEGLVSAPGRDGRREVIGRRSLKEEVG